MSLSSNQHVQKNNGFSKYGSLQPKIFFFQNLTGKIYHFQKNCDSFHIWVIPQSDELFFQK